jgi:hypothetical protein
MTVREHLAELHGEAAAHHDAKASYHDSREKSHMKHAALHKTMHKNAGMSEDQEGPHLSFALLHEQDAALHKTAAAHHRRYADYHRNAAAETAKAMDSDLSKVQPLPSGLSRVAPENPNRMVRRPGQPEPERPPVPLEFEKLVAES